MRYYENATFMEKSGRQCGLDRRRSQGFGQISPLYCEKKSLWYRLTTLYTVNVP